MLVTHELNIDLTKHSRQPEVAAVQGEANSRQLAISLFSNSIAWEIPNGATAAVAFLKPDGTKGLYDKLPDGTEATTMSGNTVNAILAPQALTCAGIVLASVIFYDADGDTLATFPFRILVAQNPAAGEQISNDYYSPSIHDLDRAIEALEEQVEALDPDTIKDVIRHTPQELTDEQKEQARENIGAASKEDLESLDFMPPDGNPEAEVRFDVAHAQMMTAPEFVIADPESSAGSILLTKEGAEEDEEPRKAVMLTDPSGNPVVMSNVADPEKETDVANKKFVREQVEELGKYLEDLVFDETIQVYGAKVGQLLKVKAVDDQGHPTAWETVGDGYECLYDLTIEAAVVGVHEDLVNPGYFSDLIIIIHTKAGGGGNGIYYGGSNSPSIKMGANHATYDCVSVAFVKMHEGGATYQYVQARNSSQNIGYGMWYTDQLASDQLLSTFDLSLQNNQGAYQSGCRFRMYGRRIR